MAAALHHDAVDHGQAQPGSESGLLGGEEGLEDTRQGVPVHAFPAVGHQQPHVRSGRKQQRLRTSGKDIDVRGLHMQLSAQGHGIPRIQRKVEED